MERIVHHFHAPGGTTARNCEANAACSQTSYRVLGALSENFVMIDQSPIDIGENEGNRCGRIVRLHALANDMEVKAQIGPACTHALGDPIYWPELNRIGWPSMLLK